MFNTTQEFTDGWVVAERVRSQFSHEASIVRHRLGLLRSLLQYEVLSFRPEGDLQAIGPETAQCLRAIEGLMQSVRDLEFEVDKLPYLTGLANELKQNGFLCEAAKISMNA